MYQRVSCVPQDPICSTDTRLFSSVPCVSQCLVCSPEYRMFHQVFCVPQVPYGPRSLVCSPGSHIFHSLSCVTQGPLSSRKYHMFLRSPIFQSREFPGAPLYSTDLRVFPRVSMISESTVCSLGSSMVYRGLYVSQRC